MTTSLTTREVEDADADALVALVDSAYREYPGCVLDLEGEDADLQQPASVAARNGSRWWVVEDDGRAVATVAAGALQPSGALELKRLYVAASHRRRGLGARLVALVEDRARQLGADRIVLWSDTRFTDAHRLYERLGYEDTGARRDL